MRRRLYRGHRSPGRHPRSPRRAPAGLHLLLDALAQRHEPLRADLYVQSDKLAKQARFVFDWPAAPTLVSEMLLQDQLSTHKLTRVQYLQRQPREVPTAWLNPMALVRNPNLE